jgi:hypothetical protein
MPFFLTAEPACSNANPKPPNSAPLTDFSLPVFRARSKTNFDPDATFSTPGSGLAG